MTQNQAPISQRMNREWYVTARARQTAVRDTLLEGLKPLTGALMSNAGFGMILGKRVSSHYAAVVHSVVRLVDYIEGMSMLDGSIRGREREMRRAVNNQVIFRNRLHHRTCECSCHGTDERER